LGGSIVFFPKINQLVLEISNKFDFQKILFCVGMTKCRQIVMRQVDVRYVTVEFLHV